jgi:hypothetical protein
MRKAGIHYRTLMFLAQDLSEGNSAALTGDARWPLGAPSTGDAWAARPVDR